MFRCMGCMEEFDESKEICPYCGYVRGTKAEKEYFLAPESIVGERYIVGKVIAYGGGSITYVAWDSWRKSEHAKVFLKEFFPEHSLRRMADGQTLDMESVSDASLFEERRKAFRQKYSVRKGNGESYTVVEDNHTLYAIRSIPSYTEPFGDESEDKSATVLMRTRPQPQQPDNSRESFLKTDYDKRRSDRPTNQYRNEGGQEIQRRHVDSTGKRKRRRIFFAAAAAAVFMIGAAAAYMISDGNDPEVLESIALYIGEDQNAVYECDFDGNSHVCNLVYDSQNAVYDIKASYSGGKKKSVSSLEIENDEIIGKQGFFRNQVIVKSPGETKVKVWNKNEESSTTIVIKVNGIKIVENDVELQTGEPVLFNGVGEEREFEYIVYPESDEQIWSNEGTSVTFEQLKQDACSGRFRLTADEVGKTLLKAQYTAESFYMCNLVVQGISLSGGFPVSLSRNQKTELSAVIYTNEENPSAVWSCSDEAVCSAARGKTVENGEYSFVSSADIRAKAAGKTKVTVSCGEYSRTFTVNVTARPVTVAKINGIKKENTENISESNNAGDAAESEKNSAAVGTDAEAAPDEAAQEIAEEETEQVFKSETVSGSDTERESEKQP